MSKTNYLETAMLNHVLRAVPYTPPATIYVALYTAAPGEAGGGTEVSGGSYARQPSAFSVPAPDSVLNIADIYFPVATADWGTVVAVALLDAPVAGNMLYYANLTASRTILTADQFRIPLGQLLVSED